MNIEDKIYVAGHNGMVGSAIIRLLKSKGFENIITKSSANLDLRNQKMVEDFFSDEKPQIVFMAAAKVGGIYANNTYRADFIYDNLIIEANVINSAHKNKVNKLLFLGSSCIYPKLAPQPLKEAYLLTGSLEATNEPYAIAKIAGVKLCEAYHHQYGANFISVMPTNLYGPNDNYDLNNSHVLPALLRKFHTAKITNQESVEIWGTGTAMREFLHVDDLAEACLFLMDKYNEPHLVNIGTGVDVTIKELALLIKEVVGYNGTLKFDPTKPDGTPRKLLDVSKINLLGWHHKINLKEGITSVYDQIKDSSIFNS